MTRVVRNVALLSAFLAFAVPSAAQDALNKRVTLDLKAMAPSDALKVIATAIGYTVDVAPDVATPVDIVVGNITAKTALNTICESIGCAWQASGTVIRVTRALPGTLASDRSQFAVMRRSPGARGAQAKTGSTTIVELRRRLDQVLPADMKFENAPMAQVAERLSKATGFEITFSGDASPGRTFSGDLSNRPFSEAMKAISQGSFQMAVQMFANDRPGGLKISLVLKPRK
jgi:hypothetical protein